MSDVKHIEGEILQARERLARALTRLSTLVGGVPARMTLLDRARNDAVQKLKEAQTLIENERAINAQRDSLSEDAKAELQAAGDRLRDAELIIGERDTTISELHSNLSLLESEVNRKDLEVSSSREHIVSLEQKIVLLQDEHEHIVRQLELLKEERDKATKDLHETKTEDETIALKFTSDERLSLLKTVDALIERVDDLTSTSNGRQK